MFISRISIPGVSAHSRMALSIMDVGFAQNAVLIRYKLFDNTIGIEGTQWDKKLQPIIGFKKAINPLSSVNIKLPVELMKML